MESVTLIQFRPAYDVLAYFAFAGPPLSKCGIENVAYPTLQACNRLPCLRIRDSTSFIPSYDIFDYLKQNFADLDAGLPFKTTSELKAISSQIRFELELALTVARYDDEEHWRKVTYPTLLKALPAPFNRFVARKIRYDSLKTLESLPNGKIGDRMKWAIQSVRIVYKSFSDRVDDGSWILKTLGPTSVDCLLFGHLAQAKFEPGLCEVVAEFPALESFFQKTLQKLRKTNFFSVGISSFPGPELDLTLVSIPSSFARIPENIKNSPKISKEKEEYTKDGIYQAISFTFLTIVAYLGWSGMLVFREKQEEDFEEE